MEAPPRVEPPPLPPKMRRAPSDSRTVTSPGCGVLTVRSSSGSTPTSSTSSHVVKIRINPEATTIDTLHALAEMRPSPCIRINVNGDTAELTQNLAAGDRTFFYYGSIMSSGQVSPSDTLDSGTCSDLDSTPPPALPVKTSKTVGGVSVTVISSQHQRAPSLTSSGADADSDDNESSISCDSLNGSEGKVDECKASAFLPQGLLQDIRERCNKLTPNARSSLINDNAAGEEATKIAQTELEDRGLKVIVEECTYEERQRQTAKKVVKLVPFESDKFINFHLNEKFEDPTVPKVNREADEHGEDDSFVGYKDLLETQRSGTIRSAKGTIRGVKNRVRAGIATFLNINDQTKTYKEKDSGKVVVYTTTMGIIRQTFHACMKVKQILRTQLARFEERDVFMSNEYQMEIRERMRSDHILVPQVFVDGQHIGDVETVEKLNESGELRRILRPYKSLDACATCQVCGGYNLLPCPVCNGSKKSLHRNHFTAEFVALKCMNCDEVGLVKCSTCAL